jgi:hypothetical protein
MENILKLCNVCSIRNFFTVHLSFEHKLIPNNHEGNVMVWRNGTNKLNRTIEAVYDAVY